MNKHLKKLPTLIFLALIGLLFTGAIQVGPFRFGTSGCVDMDKARREAAKEIPHPEVSLRSAPSEPKRGDKITVIPKPLYFVSPIDELYYTWAIDTGQPSAVSFQPLAAGKEDTGLAGGNDGFIFVPDVSKETNPYTGANMGLPRVPGLKNDFGIFYTVSGNIKDVMNTPELPFNLGNLLQKGGTDRAIVTRAPYVDSEPDGMDDNWERKYFGNLSARPDGDPDDDGYLADDFKTTTYKWNEVRAESSAAGVCGEKSFTWGGWKDESVTKYETRLTGWLCYKGTAEVEGGEGGGGGSAGSGGKGGKGGKGDTGTGGSGGSGGSGGAGGGGGEGGGAEIYLPPDCQLCPWLEGGSGDGHIYLVSGGGSTVASDCGMVDLVSLPAGTYTVKACLADGSEAYKVVASFSYPVFTSSEFGRTAAPDVGDNDPESPPDTTGDGRFTNLEEYVFGTDPTHQDSDRDGFNDEQDVVGLGQEKMNFTIPEDLPEIVEWYRIYSLVLGISQKYKILEKKDQTYLASSSAQGEDFKVFIVSGEEGEIYRKLEVELSTEDVYPSVGTPVKVLATPAFSELDYNHLWYKWELTYKATREDSVWGSIGGKAQYLDPPDGTIFHEGKRTFTFTPTAAGIFRVRVFVKERQEEEYYQKVASGQLIIEAGSKIELQFNSGTQPPNLLTGDVFTVTAQPTFMCSDDGDPAKCAYVWYLDGLRQKNVPGSPQQFRLVVDKPAGTSYKLKVTVTNIDGSETATKEIELFVYAPDVKIIPTPDTRRPTIPIVIADVATGDTITLRASPGPVNSVFANGSLSYIWTIDGAKVWSEELEILGIAAGLSGDGKTLTLLIERKRGSRYKVGLAAVAIGDDKNPAGRKATDDIILQVVETPCKAVEASCTTNEECCSGYCEEGVCRPILLGYFGSIFAALGFFIPPSFKLALKIGLAGLGILILMSIVFSITGSWDYRRPKKK